MAAVMINLSVAINILKDRFPTAHIKCIETGTIRSYHEHHGSTFVISKALGNRGSLISVDNLPKSITISKDICKNTTNVKWVLSDSVEYLKANHNKFHFAFLDSKNVSNFIYEEFRLIAPKIIAGGIIIVDDAGVDIDGRVAEGVQQKGHKIAKLLKSLDCTNFVKRAPGHGTQLWIDTKSITFKDFENG